MEAPRNLGADYVRRFRAIYPELARESGAALVPFLLEGVGGVESLNQADGIHPTAAGHERMAETVWRVLEPVLRRPDSSRARKRRARSAAQNRPGARVAATKPTWPPVRVISRSTIPEAGSGQRATDARGDHRVVLRGQDERRGRSRRDT